MTDQESMGVALRPFGWICGPEFWRRYHADPWVFHLANAVERLHAENVELRADLDRRCLFRPAEPEGGTHG